MCYYVVISNEFLLTGLYKKNGNRLKYQQCFTLLIVTYMCIVFTNSTWFLDVRTSMYEIDPNSYSSLTTIVVNCEEYVDAKSLSFAQFHTW